MLHQHAPTLLLVTPPTTATNFFKLPFRSRRRYSVAAVLPAILVLNAESFTPSDEGRDYEVHDRRDSVLSAKAIEAGYPMEIELEAESTAPQPEVEDEAKPPLPPRSPLRDHPIFRRRASQAPSLEDVQSLRQSRPSITVTDSDGESETVVLYSPSSSYSDDADDEADIGVLLARRRRRAREEADGDEGRAESDDEDGDRRDRGRGSRRRTSRMGRKHRRRSVSRASEMECD